MNAIRKLGAMHELPEELPDGEHVMWQGAPTWWALAKSLHIRVVAAYFAALLSWYIFDTLWRGVPDPLAGIARMSSLSAGAVALFAVYAFLSRISTSYTLTNRRLIIQGGIALPISFNIPYARIASASVKAEPDATGNIVLTLAKGEKIGYVAIWPHARPWRLAAVEPMLRAIPNVDRVARTMLHLVEASGEDVIVRQPAAPSRAPAYSAADEQMIPAE